MLTEYLTMLGHFELVENEDIENLPISSKNLIWVYFTCATFLSQVIFFNTLVAVIGETYSERWANKEKYQMQQRTQIFADYIEVLTLKLPDKKYVYILQPTAEIIEDKTEQSFEQMRTQIEEIQ